MWIRINDFIINLDNVTNINIDKEYVYVSFNHAATELKLPAGNEMYWNSLAFKKEDIPEAVWNVITTLSINPGGPR